MKDMGAGHSLLEQWKQLAETENARARKAWGFEGRTGWPDAPGLATDTSRNARALRNQKVRELSAAGCSIPRISRRTGLSKTTVWRILQNGGAV